MYPNFSGQVFGEYQLQDVLGRGGMAVVYRARQTTLNRDVAVKIISAQLTGQSDFAARFRREADLIAKLEHPHILPIYTYGQQGDFLYLVVRLMEGGSLDQRVQGKPLPLVDIDRLVRQIAGALDYAHAQGIVHRDLKPNNILLDKFGNAYLMDFGIAKILTSSTQLTGTSTLMGTPAYMAPEQWKMSPIDHRADIYSLGVIAYELLTGQIPFDVPTPHQLMYAHLNVETPRPSSLIPGLLSGIDAVILKATAKEPPDRYNSAGELAAALSSAIVAQTEDVRGELVPLASRMMFSPHFTPVTQGEGQPLATSQPAGTPVSGQGAAMGTYIPQPHTPVSPFEKTAAISTGAGQKSAAASKKGGWGLLTAVVGIGLVGIALVGAVLTGVFGGGDEDEPPNTPVVQQASATVTTLSTENTSETSEPTGVTATAEVTVTTSIAASETSTATSLPGATTESPTATVDFARQTIEVQQTIDALVAQNLAAGQTAAALTVVPSATQTLLPTVTSAPTLTPAIPTSIAAANTPFVVPQPTATPAIYCPGTQPSRMQVAIRGRTTFTDGTTTNLRVAPEGQVVERMVEGLEFDIVGGPTCSGGYVWWQLRLASGRVGWAAEGEPGRYFIEPLPGVTIPSVRVLQAADDAPNPQVYTVPSAAGLVIETLQAGDRVAWTGGLLDNEGSTWALVTTYDGVAGYVMYRSDWLIETNSRVSTFGLALSARVRVLSPGDLANLRVSPDTSAERVQTLAEGDLIRIVGGPAYADYFIWWQYQLSDGTIGWVVDVPGWFEVVQ